MTLGSSWGRTRLAPGLVRLPDVSFVSWSQLAERRVPREAILGLAPQLAIEVLSQSNTVQEMARKLDDYFNAGVKLVWYVDPRLRTVTVYMPERKTTVLNDDRTLDG